jgi:hypothetical protein
MTPLNDYLHKLLGDDDKLKHFLADPVAQCEEHGLSKAERSVLRRVATTASTDSTNGYAIVRPLEAYRQAIRMMQNVLHNNMGTALASGSVASNSLYLYYSGNPSDPTTNPYYYGKAYSGTGATIGALMENIVATGGGLSYTNATGNYPDLGPFIGSFTVEGGIYNAPPPFTTKDYDIPFWFFSINGFPGPMNSGKNGQSYYDFAINPGDVVYWQVIAPSQDRGFQPCAESTSIHTAGLV